MAGVPLSQIVITRQQAEELVAEFERLSGDLRVPRSLIRSVPRLRMLDEYHFRSLGKLVVGNLDRIADVDNVGN
jgi:hypothetical protein